MYIQVQHSVPFTPEYCTRNVVNPQLQTVHKALYSHSSEIKSYKTDSLELFPTAGNFAFTKDKKYKCSKAVKLKAANMVLQNTALIIGKIGEHLSSFHAVLYDSNTPLNPFGKKVAKISRILKVLKEIFKNICTHRCSEKMCIFAYLKVNPRILLYN